MINIWKSHYLFVSLYKSNNKTMTNTKEMTRKEAATIMKRTYPLAVQWWKSSKNEKAMKEFIEAKKIYKEILNRN